MTNDEFAARFDAIELVEEYLDRELGDEDARQFEEFFLATPESRRHLRLTENLRTFSVGVGNVVPQAKRSLFDRNATPSMQWLRFALSFVVMASAACSIWRVAPSESNTEKALAEMRRAYIGKRPAEARLTVFPDHQPFSQTRGKGVAVTDSDARDRARSYLSDATRGVAEEGAYHALGLFYLAEMNFERAEQEFNLALKFQPESASLHSDLGAMYLEKARLELFDWSPKGLVSLDLSLKHLDRAIELSPQMPEPRFNRALVLDAMKLPPLAKAAWEEYLQIDSSSKWADEARRYIQQIDEAAAVDHAPDRLASRFLTSVGISFV